MAMHLTEFESLSALDAHLHHGGGWADCVFQSLDLSAYTSSLQAETTFKNTVFLGCRFAPGIDAHLTGRGALVFPALPGVPFQPFRPVLYSAEELIVDDYTVGDPGSYDDTLDGTVYQHYCDHGRGSPDSILESLARRLHDHAITDALHEFIAQKKTAAIMGGHGMGRDNPMYLQVAHIARSLARNGFLLATGGGPGAMEATHLGVWFTHRSPDELKAAVNALCEAPQYSDEGWMDTAVKVRKQFPLQACPDTGKLPQSLGIPTWLYGHEPPTIFATHIAKYFANSVREEGLLAIAHHGVVYSPGSAGTIQEIFQDACQNHYKSFLFASPMVFFGERYWTEEKPVFPLLEQLARGHDYHALLTITDDPETVAEQIIGFKTPPVT